MADEAQQTGSTVAVDVWNRALERIGQTKRVAGPEEVSLGAASCRLHYYDALDEALELRDWDFARAQARLARLPNVERVGWAYAYALPDDFIAARGLLVGGSRLSLRGEEQEPHEIQSNDAADGELLLCDLDLGDEDRLIYTRRHTTVARWPRLFLSAVAYRLAADLALGIVKGSEGARLSRDMLALFDQGLRVAYAVRANQSKDRDPVTPSLKARE